MPKNNQPITQITEEEETSAGGESGDAESGIAFQEFISSGGPLRDDLLSGAEKKRLLQVHATQHEGLVIKQKALQEKREQVKNGKVSLESYRQEKGYGMQNSDYQNHPILSKAAQFSGMDNQVNLLPTENNAETNNDKREELRKEYNLTHRHEITAKKEPPRLVRH